VANVDFFVGDTSIRIDQIVSRLKSPDTRDQALRDLKIIRTELASVARLWASALMLTRFEITTPKGYRRLARRALGLWLADVPLEAFPNISNNLCRSLGIDTSVRARAVAIHKSLAESRSARLLTTCSQTS
jgi:hypothetical protein